MRGWLISAAGAAATLLLCWASFNAGVASSDADRHIIPDRRFFLVIAKSPERRLVFKGTWELEGPDKIAFPKQLLKVTCDERDANCEAVRAIVHKNILTVDTTWYMAKWQGNRVELSTYDAPGDCRTEMIVVDLVTEDVTSITKDAASRSPDCDATTLPISKPRIARLVDGWDKHFNSKIEE